MLTFETVVFIDHLVSSSFYALKQNKQIFQIMNAMFHSLFALSFVSLVASINNQNSRYDKMFLAMVCQDQNGCEVNIRFLVRDSFETSTKKF